MLAPLVERFRAGDRFALARLVNHLRRQTYLKRYLHVSSPEVYGNCQGTVLETAPLNPSTPYAASKIMGEFLARSYVKAYGLDILSVRPFNHIGPGQTADFVCSDFARQIAERFHPDKIILFGSYAYGQPHAESDVDLLVIMPTRNAIDQGHLHRPRV